MEDLVTLLHSLFQELNTRLQEGRERNLEYVDAIYRDGITLYDVTQNKKNIRQIDALCTLSDAPCWFPDFLLRDRIYVPPEYLQILIGEPRIPIIQYKQRLDELMRNPPPEFSSIYRKYDETSYQTFADLTREANKLIGKIEAGFTAFDSIAMKLYDGNYIIMKLCRSDIDSDYSLLFQVAKFSDSFNLSLYEELVMKLVRHFYSG